MINSLPEQQIRHVIRQAGQQAKRMSADQFQVLQKGPDDFVTSVDQALDRLLTDQFSTWFPADGVITEENPASTKAFHQGHERLWVIDPLDGTDDFIQGHPAYAVMVGLLQDHQPAAGWVYAPAQDHLYFGGPGWGLFHTLGDQAPQALTPRPATSKNRSILIGYKDRRQYGEAIGTVIPEVQFCALGGSFGLKVLEVVQGQAGVYLYLNGRVKLWDTTGPLALAQAAGLTCCDLDGQPIRCTPDAVNPDTLIHRQPILIGWPDCVEALRPRLAQAISPATT